MSSCRVPRQTVTSCRQIHSSFLHLPVLQLILKLFWPKVKIKRKKEIQIPRWLNKSNFNCFFFKKSGVKLYNTENWIETAFLQHSKMKFIDVFAFTVRITGVLTHQLSNSLSWFCNFFKTLSLTVWRSIEITYPIDLRYFEEVLT